jgi:hypothetical protein
LCALVGHWSVWVFKKFVFITQKICTGATRTKHYRCILSVAFIAEFRSPISWTYMIIKSPFMFHVILEIFCKVTIFCFILFTVMFWLDHLNNATTPQEHASYIKNTIMSLAVRYIWCYCWVVRTGLTLAMMAQGSADCYIFMPSNQWIPVQNKLHNLLCVCINTAIFHHILSG